MKWLKLISAIALILSVAPSHAQTPGKIAYIANNPSTFEFNIFIMDEDGNNVQQLTDLNFRVGGRELYSISYSPDGNRIAFKYQNQIYLMDADGSNMLPLTEGNVVNENPSWSPDGTKIIFASRDRSLPAGSRQNDIFVIDVDGSNLVQLTHTDSQHESYPSWSPDGGKILYSAQPLEGGPMNIFVMHADGSNPIPLTDDAALNQGPRFSPDGSKIVYTQEFDPEALVIDIIVMNADGSNPVNLTSSTDQDGDASWSPDGSKLIFSSDRPYGDGYPFNLYIMDVDGSNVVQLTFGVRDWREPSAGRQHYFAAIWSPTALPTTITPASWGQVKWEFR